MCATRGLLHKAKYEIIRRETRNCLAWVGPLLSAARARELRCALLRDNDDDDEVSK